MGDPGEDRAKAEKYPEGDVLGILYRQHADITEALDRVSRGRGQDRKSSFDAVVAFLKSHETAEQEVVRPLVESDADPAEAAARNAEEKQADAAIAELTGLDVDSDEFGTKFTAFKKAVSAHAESEEHDEFPLLEARPDAERAELGRRFLDTQAAAAR